MTTLGGEQEKSDSERLTTTDDKVFSDLFVGFKEISQYTIIFRKSRGLPRPPGSCLFNAALARIASSPVRQFPYTQYSSSRVAGNSYHPTPESVITYQVLHTFLSNLFYTKSPIKFPQLYPSKMSALALAVKIS